MQYIICVFQGMSPNFKNVPVIQKYGDITCTKGQEPASIIMIFGTASMSALASLSPDISVRELHSNGVLVVATVQN